MTDRCPGAILLLPRLGKERFALTRDKETLHPTEKGATVVITHRVHPGKESLYDDWLDEIGPLCRSSAGLLDWQIIRPIAGLTATYTVIIRFDTREHLENWMLSPQRKRLIEQVRPLLATEDDFTIRSGLDFWFTPEGAQARIPVRWKQFLITWSAIYPLVLGVPLVLCHCCGSSGSRRLVTLTPWLLPV